ncbi:uncharacterized protein LACBIDRAFT_333541 [Laccaria bicolor S238N-H82]|uniref:Predicted protein n=1 Tax=Laccaria bicolor (strain S238N-H82 / ATCC MYA-4686) TaxID=486041 RepID=B0DW88_LACBS|nr:uncharacterized protein LACBIDRAFT_333541 [Laccaria bicolor S238N-H82]EDR01145.1 predicted protein [Laccaria bicolor S238N-H82]|eukprot:XP_001888187.1 predicted protein [Laccaria bicolor S238N-H82]
MVAYHWWVDDCTCLVLLLSQASRGSTDPPYHPHLWHLQFSTRFSQITRYEGLAHANYSVELIALNGLVSLEVSLYGTEWNKDSLVLARMRRLTGPTDESQNPEQELSSWTFTIWPGPALMTTGATRTYAIERVSICGDSFVLYDSRSKCLFSSVIIVYWFKLPEGPSQTLALFQNSGTDLAISKCQCTCCNFTFKMLAVHLDVPRQLATEIPHALQLDRERNATSASRILAVQGASNFSTTYTDRLISSTRFTSMKTEHTGNE